MSEPKAQQASAVSRGAKAKNNVHMVRNILVIWLDEYIDVDDEDCQNTIALLRGSVKQIKTFMDIDRCIKFLADLDQKKACMIISGSFGQQIVPLIHEMSQVDSIFIFCSNKKFHEKWASDWSKIKGVFIDINLICEALDQAAQYSEHNAVPISYMAENNGTDNDNLDRLDVSFMYTQILKEILLTIEFEPKHFKEFINYIRELFDGNKDELQNIKRFERTYHKKTPIWWYTTECFLYPMLNHALRTMDTNIIVQMGFYIKDLHKHIGKLHSQQFNGKGSGDKFTVYRGQSLCKADFDKLVKNNGKLIAFNSFISTSINPDVSLDFVRPNLDNPDTIGILFIMTINPSESTTPFAFITEESAEEKEDEILFSMHSVFRIRDIKSMDESNRLYQVNLILTNDNDKDLRILTERIRKEVSGTGWARLGNLLRKMGQLDKAEKVYEDLLRQATDESGKGDFYHQLGWIKEDQGKYQEAIELYKKSLKIRERILPPNHPELGSSYNRIGVGYHKMRSYSKALSNYETALSIRIKSLPSNHSDLGTSYNNVGLVYCNTGDFSKALSYHEKALEIQRQSLPVSHPDLGSTYNNIGLVYHKMGDCSKALPFYKKDLEILQQSLPPDHSDLGMSYNNIGVVYCNVGDYPTALSYHKKALAIREQSLPSNHPDLGSSYTNIGMVYQRMGKYSKALSYYEKNLAILQQLNPPNRHSLAAANYNIGMVHEEMRMYSKAHSYYEQAVKIAQQVLHSNDLNRLQWEKNLQDIKKKL